MSSQELVKQLFATTQLTDQLLKSLKQKANHIKGKYEPRRQFNRWRDSEEGKSWKKQQWNFQKGCCAICCQKIDLKGSHIDHIIPIFKKPSLAINTQNMRVTCADCNLVRNYDNLL